MNEENIENLAPHELDMLHSLLGRWRTQRATSTTAASQSPPTAPNMPALPSTSPQMQRNGIQPVTAYTPRAPSQSSVLPSIPAYQSTRFLNSGTERTSPSSSGMGFPSLSQQRTPMLPIQQQRPSFLGFQGNTSRVNQQRLASAAISLPRRPSMPARTTTAAVARRTRGQAVRPPSLSTTPTINDVLVHDIVNDAHFMRTRIKVYPPLGEHGIDYYVYRFLRDSFNETLRSNHLLFDMDISVSSTVTDIVRSVVGKMQESPFQYSFGDRGRSQRVLPHEALHLGLLRIVNRGRVRASHNQVRLQAHPMMNDITLEAMVTEHATHFVIPGISFEDKRLVLFFGVMGRTLKARLPAGSGDERRRLHTCISQSLWVRFPNDRQDNSEPDYYETSGGETEADSDQSPSDCDDGLGEISNETVSTLFIHPGPQLGSTSGNSAPSNRPASEAMLPPELWSVPWIVPQTDVEVVDLSNLDDSIFEMASGSNPPKLEIAGTSVSILADRLIEAIMDALDQQDFEKILSAKREFLILHTTPEGRQQIRSLGRGIEHEVIHLAYSRYSSQEPQWFLPRAGGYCSIAVTHTMASVSNVRLKNLSIFEALTGLMLVYGMAPMPLSPVLIHFFIHDCNLQSIYPSFLAEWIPELHKTLKDWLSMDYKSDISMFQPHFSTYHDVQVACLHDRDADSHKALASEMLYRAIVGPEPHTHREIQAFLQGFRMPCPRTGFELTKVKKFIEGGSESFLNMVWTSHIKSFDDISPHLRFCTPSRSILSQLSMALSSQGGVTFETLLHDFLQGSGIPCPKLFENAQHHFNSVVDISKIDDIGFRPRIFYWAATGSPAIEINGVGISISLCGLSDAEYAPAATRDAMINEGKICFKTCFSQVKIPASYVEKLAGATYEADLEPNSFRKAFDHWLLCEFLNAIGTHSLL